MVLILTANGQNMAGGTIGTVAAAGSTAADATLLCCDLNYVSAGDGTKGVILSNNVQVGSAAFISNESGSILKVYPPTSGTLNALTATSGSVSIAANKAGIFWRLTDIKWGVAYA